jgi:hypothetical protein
MVIITADKKLLGYGTCVRERGKGKVKLPCAITGHHAMEAYWEMDV